MREKIMKKSLVSFVIAVLGLIKVFATDPGDYFYFDRFYGTVNEDNQITNLNNTVPSSGLREDYGIGFNPSWQSVIIPSEVEGMSVVSIEKDAFSGNADIKYVYIPATITYIGYKAFSACYNIEDFVIDPENPYYEAKDDVIYE